jgi:thiamine-phosphate pyrophosphorylase
MTLPRLLLLTDRTQLPPGRGLVDTVEACVDAGLAAVVVREHDLDPGARTALVADLTRLPGLTVISSRIADPAAHGLHLAAAGQDTCNTPFAALSGRCNGQVDGSTACYMRLGRSCHTPDEVRRAADEGATYATLSPYAASRSKPGYGPPLPTAAFAGHPIPVFALGGIDPGNAARARAAGAHGVAVMGAVMRADDPAAVAQALLEAVR